MLMFLILMYVMNFLKLLFFPSIVIELKKVGPDIHKFLSLSIFEKKLLIFIRPIANITFKCHSSIGIKFTMLRLGLSHCHQHKFKHNFQDTLNPICKCSKNTETAIHYLWHCFNYFNEQLTFLNKLRTFDTHPFMWSEI